MDLIGIGLGPSNLSLAALLNPLPQFSYQFLEKEKDFQWHSGMQLPFADLQVSHLKDLVTMVDPQSPFSFLSYLSSQKRLYQFINASFQRVSRTEYNQYYRWVCTQLEAKLSFDTEVTEVQQEKGAFTILSNKGRFRAKNLVLGCGLNPTLPPFIPQQPSQTVFHSSCYRDLKLSYGSKRVDVVGGGQSGAEIVLDLLSAHHLPSKLHWITRRDNYLPLDESPFVNELFTPDYSHYFYSLPPDKQKKILKEQKLASEGISLSTLEALYRRIYHLHFLQEQKLNLCLMPRTKALNLVKADPHWQLHIKELISEREKMIEADTIIFCTGYHFRLPAFLEPLHKKIHKDEHGDLLIKEDYSLDSDLPASTKIYIQNGARHCRGVADPNLSLSAWRSAHIINSFAQKNIYDTSPYPSLFRWNEEGEKGLHNHQEIRYA